MDTKTMLCIIAIFALPLIWAIVRIRRKVLAFRAAIQQQLDEVAARRAREQREFSGTNERRKVSTGYHGLGRQMLREEHAAASPSYGHPTRSNTPQKGTL